MNIIKVQQTFKRLPDEKVAEYVKDPALGFIALMELNERKKERDRYQAQSQEPDVPLSERIPQELGIMSQSMQQPMQPMQQPPVGMYGGGIVAFRNGGLSDEFAGMLPTSEAQIEEDKERIRRLLARQGTSPSESTRAYLEGTTVKPAVVDEANVTGGPGTQIVPQRPPVRTTTQAGPTKAPTQAQTPSAGIASFTPQTMEEMITASKKGAGLLEKEFPDTVSPLMKEYQDYLRGRKTSEEEARREGFRQFGLKALQGTSRDFFQNIGAAGEAGLGAYKAVQQKNAQIDDTIMQQKIAMAQADDARKRGNFELAGRLNEKAEALKVQGITLSMEKAKLEDQIKTNAVQRKLYETKIGLAPLQARAALMKAQNAGNVKPADYARVLKDFEASPQYRSLLQAAQASIANKYGKDALKSEKGQQALRDLIQPEIQSQVFQRMGLDPSKARVGYAYSSKDTDED